MSKTEKIMSIQFTDERVSSINLPDGAVNQVEAERIVMRAYKKEPTKVMRFCRFRTHINVHTSTDFSKWVEKLRGMNLYNGEGVAGEVFDQDPVFICGRAHMLAKFAEVDPTPYPVDNLITMVQYYN